MYCDIYMNTADHQYLRYNTLKNLWEIGFWTEDGKDFRIVFTTPDVLTAFIEFQKRIGQGTSVNLFVSYANGEGVRL